jgi:hypothetical protein
MVVILLHRQILIVIDDMKIIIVEIFYIGFFYFDLKHNFYFLVNMHVWISKLYIINSNENWIFLVNRIFKKKKITRNFLVFSHRHDFFRRLLRSVFISFHVVYVILKEINYSFNLILHILCYSFILKTNKKNCRIKYNKIFYQLMKLMSQMMMMTQYLEMTKFFFIWIHTYVILFNHYSIKEKHYRVLYKNNITENKQY